MSNWDVSIQRFAIEIILDYVATNLSQGEISWPFFGLFTNMDK